MNNSNDTLLFCRSTQKLWITLKSKKNKATTVIVCVCHMIYQNTIHYTTIQYIASFLIIWLQVKKIMEESVTKKFVHEDSGSVTLFCGKSFLCTEMKAALGACGSCLISWISITYITDVKTFKFKYFKSVTHENAKKRNVFKTNIDTA